MDSTLFLCFKGVDMPEGEEEKVNDIISGRVFLKLLAKHDTLFGMLWLDHKDSVLSTRTPLQSLKNWRYISTILDDHGLEISSEVMFSVVSGQEATAVQLATELRGIADPNTERSALRRVGPAVPIRERVNPFLGTAVGQTTTQSKSLLGGSSANPTRLYIHDPNRFMKKRSLFCEQVEKLREKEIRQQRLKEKKEREEKQRLLEQQKKTESLGQQRADEQFINETLLLHRADPEKLREKKHRTELLHKLEVLESAFTQDQRKMLRIKSKMQNPTSPRGGPATSPTHRPGSSSPQRRPVSPHRLRAATSIPFSKPPPKKDLSDRERLWK